jgi:exosortase A-associated hydrolase 2
MREKPFFFANGDQDLFGVLHEPESEPRDCGFVFCSAFAEEKLWTHRVFVSFARRLAETGFPVLRFDFRGHGDSEGEFSDSTVETRLADISRAVQVLAERSPRISRVGLLGMRFGATLAALAADRERCGCLILWEPIIDGSAYMREMLRSNLATQMAVYKEIRCDRAALVQQLEAGASVNIDGYEMRGEFFEQASSIDLLVTENRHTGPTLIVPVSRVESPFNKKVAALAKTYPDCQLSLAVEQPFWKEIRPYYAVSHSLFEVTLDWLRRQSA